MRNDRENIIVEKTFQFSLKIITYCEGLLELKKFSMADQIFRSGTSIGANVREAQNAESKKDIIHKMKISAKEADEVDYFLPLCKESEFYPDPGAIFHEVKEIQLILSKSIASAKKNISN
jgi:four helix bundle protein